MFSFRDHFKQYLGKGAFQSGAKTFHFIQYA